MAEKFDIIEYLSGLTGYVFSKAILKSVALERGVLNVESYEELDVQTRDLLRADLLYRAYLSPNNWASVDSKHNGFSHSIGSQHINSQEKERIYNSFRSIYKKYDDAKLKELEDLDSNLQWLDF